MWDIFVFVLFACVIGIVLALLYCFAYLIKLAAEWLGEKRD